MCVSRVTVCSYSKVLGIILCINSVFSIFSSIPDHNLHNTLEHSNKGEIDTRWVQIYPVYIYKKARRNYNKDKVRIWVFSIHYSQEIQSTTLLLNVWKVLLKKLLSVIWLRTLLLLSLKNSCLSAGNFFSAKIIEDFVVKRPVK